MFWNWPHDRTFLFKLFMRLYTGNPNPGRKRSGFFYAQKRRGKNNSEKNGRNLALSNNGGIFVPSN